MTAYTDTSVTLASSYGPEGSPQVEQATTSLGSVQPTPAPRSLARPRQSHVLIVDDDVDNAELLKTYLERIGYQATTATSGNEAIRHIENESFDLVLLDVIMPDMGGREVLAQIRNRHDASDLPVIMTTALDSTTDVVSSLRLGANDYITKPLDIEVVAARISAQLRTKQARDRVRQLHHALDQAVSHLAKVVAAETTLDPSGGPWVAAATEQLRNTLGQNGVAIWIRNQDEQLQQSCLEPPRLADIELLERSELVVRESSALIPIEGQSNQLLGAIGIVTDGTPLDETVEHVVITFARQLGNLIELGEARRQLTLSVGRRKSAEQELTKSSVGLLHMCPQCDRCYSHLSSHCQLDGTELSPSEAPMPYLVARRYRLVRRVGQGGMGMVFQAHDERLQRNVAVKVLRSEHFENQSIRTRFTTEAQIIASLDVPGIVEIFDFGIAEGRCLFIVMEWLDGMDLAALLKQQGPGSPAQVAELLRQTGTALEAAHAEGLIHRDIKPGNLFVQSTHPLLQTKILDFGVAKHAARNPALTGPGSLVGTPRYMSPEQLLGGEVDARTDLYALAMVGYEALVGHLPARGSRGVLHSNRPLRFLSQELGDIPTELDEAFLCALAWEATERPRSVSEWLQLVCPKLGGVRGRHHWELPCVLGESRQRALR